MSKLITLEEYEKVKNSRHRYRALKFVVKYTVYSHDGMVIADNESKLEELDKPAFKFNKLSQAERYCRIKELYLRCETEILVEVA